MAEQLFREQEEKAVWKLLNWRVLQGWHLRDLIIACAAMVQGTLSGEILDVICKRSPQCDLGLSKSCSELQQTDLFHCQRNCFIPQIALLSRAIPQQTSSAPANCSLKLVRIKKHFLDI